MDGTFHGISKAAMFDKTLLIYSLLVEKPMFFNLPFFNNYITLNYIPEIISSEMTLPKILSISQWVFLSDYYIMQITKYMVHKFRLATSNIMPDSLTYFHYFIEYRM